MQSEITKIHDSVEKCNKCIDLVEKFSGNSVHLGKISGILLVGEAPANNG